MYRNVVKNKILLNYLDLFEYVLKIDVAGNLFRGAISVARVSGKVLCEKSEDPLWGL